MSFFYSSYGAGLLFRKYFFHGPSPNKGFLPGLYTRPHRGPIGLHVTTPSGFRPIGTTTTPNDRHYGRRHHPTTRIQYNRLYPIRHPNELRVRHTLYRPSIDPRHHGTPNANGAIFGRPILRTTFTLYTRRRHHRRQNNIHNGAKVKYNIRVSHTTRHPRP